MIHPLHLPRPSETIQKRSKQNSKRTNNTPNTKNAQNYTKTNHNVLKLNQPRPTKVTQNSENTHLTVIPPHTIPKRCQNDHIRSHTWPYPSPFLSFAAIVSLPKSAKFICAASFELERA